MHHQVPLDDQARADDPQHDAVRAIAPDLAYVRVVFVNVQLVGTPGAGDRQWVLVDTGVPGGSARIIRAAEERFGANARPAAIVMTHGHFDHAGTVDSLAEKWDAPVYAHTAELPYLNGQASYPPADPTVGGGLMSRLSPLLPSGPVNVSRWLHALPDDRSVPGMPGWRWIHTPGHTPGHVSLWRDADRTLIAGDAFITTNMESAYGALSQRSEMHGPPQFITQDWVQSKASVQRLAALEPELAVTGHGHAMRGAEMRSALHTLARDFDTVAVPRKGQYVDHPAKPYGGSGYRAVDWRG